MNPHKDMGLFRIWLTTAEERELRDSVDTLNTDGTSRDNGIAMATISEVIQDVMNRGDLI
jgi:hypothetical protein